MNPGLVKAQAQYAENAARRLADIDADVALGIEPARIASDQQRTLNALEKFCQRHHRPDLAAFFQAQHKQTGRRTGTCLSCGGACYRGAQRCTSCWKRWVRGDAA